VNGLIRTELTALDLLASQPGNACSAIFELRRMRSEIKIVAYFQAEEAV
jgi:hypothetical protein